MSTTAEKIKIMQAAEDGRAIQCRSLRGNDVGNWIPFRTGPDAAWNWLGCIYRLAPEEPREFWVNEHSNEVLSIYTSEELAEKSPWDQLHLRTVHCREVTEQDGKVLKALEDLVAFLSTDKVWQAIPELINARKALGQ